MVGRAVLEQVAHEAFGTVIGVGVVVPDLLFRTEIAVVVVETIDELLAVDVALIGFTAVPEMDVCVDDEVLVAILLVHR